MFKYTKCTKTENKYTERLCYGRQWAVVHHNGYIMLTHRNFQKFKHAKCTKTENKYTERLCYGRKRAFVHHNGCIMLTHRIFQNFSQNALKRNFSKLFTKCTKTENKYTERLCYGGKWAVVHQNGCIMLTHRNFQKFKYKILNIFK